MWKATKIMAVISVTTASWAATPAFAEATDGAHGTVEKRSSAPFCTENDISLIITAHRNLKSYLEELDKELQPVAGEMLALKEDRESIEDPYGPKAELLRKKAGDFQKILARVSNRHEAIVHDYSNRWESCKPDARQAKRDIALSDSELLALISEGAEWSKRIKKIGEHLEKRGEKPAVDPLRTILKPPGMRP